MNSLIQLLAKPEALLSAFEKEVVESQKKALLAKKTLEDKVGETTFGMNLNSPLCPKLSEEQRSVEIYSYMDALVGLVHALEYLTNNKKEELTFWQFQELHNFVHEHYPQTIYGHYDISKGTPIWYGKFVKVVEENDIPISEEVRKTVYEGKMGELRSVFQEAYMARFNLPEKHAKELAEQTQITSISFTSNDSPESIQDKFDALERKKEWDEFINGSDQNK